MNKGFTLIELMVSVTIFAIVMLISMGAILTVVDGNKKNQTMQVAINNLNYAVEGMTRSIKTGYAYDVQGPSCSTPINLMNSDDQAIQYSLMDITGTSNKGLWFNNTTTGFSGFITAPDINITKLCFYKTSSGQPSLQIVIQGETTGSKDNLKTNFNLFTSVTQRQVQYD